MAMMKTHDEFVKFVTGHAYLSAHMSQELINFTTNGILPEGVEHVNGQPDYEQVKLDSLSKATVVKVTTDSAVPGQNKRLLCWGKTVTKEFRASVLWIEDQIGLNADYLMACMKFESNLNPKAKNPKSSATGLIQFMEATAKRLGTTTAKLREMDGVRQLSYVYRYFEDFHKRGYKLHEWDLMDTYMAILWPAAIGKPNWYAVFQRPDKAYAPNVGLDSDKNGVVTKAEACERVVALYREGMLETNVGEI